MLVPKQGDVDTMVNGNVAVAGELGIDSTFVRRDHRTGYELDYEPTVEVSDLAVIVDLVGTTAGSDGSAVRSD